MGAPTSDLLIAYFSMEFAVDAGLPIYSGGLGVLAGDHLKAAADLGVPLVGVGLFYRGGYFTPGPEQGGPPDRGLPRRRPGSGRARPRAGDGRRSTSPARPSTPRSGATTCAALPGPCRSTCSTSTWLTDALYGGDREHRIRQELLLGVGGVRALSALGLKPTVFHVNEGHSAFLAIERPASSREPAKTRTTRSRSSVARRLHDAHARSGRQRGLRRRARRPLRRRPRAACGLVARASCSRSGAREGANGFGLTPLALRLSAAANGVSELHGEVAREMWAPLWPGEEPPIGHVTNGVHLGTWLAPELEQLLRTVGVRPGRRRTRATGTRRIETGQRRASGRCTRRSRPGSPTLTGFDPERLTIGFARRFATYKRAGLVFSDLERLLQLPVQIVVAGKAHPQDVEGKDVMQRIVELSAIPASPVRVVFLENYDLDLARAIIPGCDIWLNTPRRPLRGVRDERDEGRGQRRPEPLCARRLVGGGVTRRRSAGRSTAPPTRRTPSSSTACSRSRSCRASRSRDEWVELMKQSIAQLAPRFSMQRAVIEYVERYYLPATAHVRAA